MIASPPAAFPRLGDSFAAFTREFGLPVRTTAVASGVLRHYPTALGSLVVLFSHDQGVGVRVPYPSPLSRTALTTLAEQFAPMDGRTTRLLVGDGGCLVVLDLCSLAWRYALAAA